MTTNQARVFWAITMAAGGALSGCGSGSSSAEAEAPASAAGESENANRVALKAEQVKLAEIRAEAARTGEIQVELALNGEVRSNQDALAHLVARVPGVVTSVRATLGARVRAGDVIAVLDSFELGEAKASYLEKRQQLDLARTDLERAQTVHDNTLAMLELLGTTPSLEELRTKQDLDLGENRSALVSAYADLRFAQASVTRERDLFARKISSQNDLLQAESSSRKAEATYHATRDQIRFRIRRNLLDRQRSLGVAEISLAASRRRLGLLGLAAAEVECPACHLAFPMQNREPTECQTCLDARKETGQGSARTASLGRYALKAPFDGTVIQKHLTLGERADGDEVLYSLCDLKSVWVIVSVYEKDVARIRPGQSATVRINAYPERSFTGKVTWIADVFDEQTRTLQVRLLVENPDGLLKPGMFAQASLAVETRGHALVIPAAAVQTQRGAPIVFVAESENTFVRRQVELGVRTASLVQVLKGLTEGERVVTNGSFILKSELEKESFEED